jgi:ABC-type phosphate transport system substrate-binding protein
MKKILTAAVLLMASFSWAGTAVIAHPGVGVSSINAQQLKDYWARDAKAWGNGTKVQLFDNTGSAKDAFYKFLGKGQSDYKKIWMKLQLAGEGRGATAAGSDEDVIAKVASTPGALGFVDDAKAKAAGAKILFVIP